MSTRVLIILSALMMSAVALAAEAAVRVAILSGEGDRAVADATLAQIEAALTNEPGVTLLERAEVRKILAECRFTATAVDLAENIAGKSALQKAAGEIALKLIPEAVDSYAKGAKAEEKAGKQSRSQS